MPYNGPSSILPMLDEFIFHWMSLNALFTLPPPAPGPLVLQGSRTLLLLQGLRTSLGTTRTDVQLKQDVKEIARADVQIRRSGILVRMGQFGDTVRANWEGLPQEAALKELPGIGDFAPHFEDKADAVVGLWSVINGSPAPVGIPLPLTLVAVSITVPAPPPPPYTQANFVADVAALRTAHTALKNAEGALDLARATRTSWEEQILGYLPDYRAAVEAKLPADHPLLSTVPRFSPLPGSTPDAANASGSWDAVAQLAALTYAPSPSASVVSYQLRYVAGPDYHTDDENVVATHAAGSPAHFETLLGLPAIGTTASYRIYAITADGNERGSNTVVVTRV